MSDQISTRRRPAALIGGALTLLLMASCATPQDVAYTRELAKDYESQVFDLQRQLAEKDASLTALSERFARDRRSTIVNASSDTNFQARLDDLASMINGMDGPVKEVERFEVEGGYLLMIQDRILFDSGSAELGQEGSAALAALSAEIAAAPHSTIYVRGHTDSDPVKKPSTLERFPHGNLQLSAERAVSVATFLIGQSNISGRDVVVMGFGSWQPLTGNDSADSKRLNRRVEIFVSDPQG